MLRSTAVTRILIFSFCSIAAFGKQPCTFDQNSFFAICNSIPPDGWPENVQNILIQDIDNKEIAKDSFNGLEDLRSISFQDSNVTGLKKCAFANLPSLLVIKFYNCKIGKIESGAFTDLTFRAFSKDEASIHFYETEIEQFSPFTFHRVKGVGALSVMSSLVKTIENGAFAGLQNIGTFYMMQSEIKLTMGWAFLNNSLERYMLIHNNTLPKMNGPIFSNAGNGDIIFTENILDSIPCDFTHALPYVEEEFPYTSEYTIYNNYNATVSGNAIQCDCRLAWLLANSTDERRRKMLDYVVGSFTCKGPMELRGRKLMDLKPEDLPCKGFKKVDDCPTKPPNHSLKPPEGQCVEDTTSRTGFAELEGGASNIIQCHTLQVVHLVYVFFVLCSE